jgi:hypothetical protein
MSQVIMMKMGLSVPQIMANTLQKLAAKNAILAEYISQMDMPSLTEECVVNTLKSLAASGKYSVKTDTSTDKAGNKVLGSIYCSNLSRDLSIAVEKNGSINFLFSSYSEERYRSRSEEEAAKIKNIFEQAFVVEAVKIALKVMGYELENHKSEITQVGPNEQLTSFISAVKEG